MEFTQAPEKHDVVIDIAGNQTLPGTRAGTGSNGPLAAAGDPNKATEAICYLEHRHANGKAVSTL